MNPTMRLAAILCLCSLIACGGSAEVPHEHEVSTAESEEVQGHGAEDHTHGSEGHSCSGSAWPS